MTSPSNRLIQRSLNKIGLEVHRFDGSIVPGTSRRPVGELTLFLEDLAARGFQPKHILDVGANHGDWSQMVKAVFPHAVYTMVEPQIEMKPYLDKFCAETPGSRWINAAAGASGGETQFLVHPDTVSSSLSAPTLVTSAATTAPKEGIEGLEQRTISVITLDSLFGDTTQPVPDFVKIDVEGFELDVLKGATRLVGLVEIFLLEVSFFNFNTSRPLVADIITFMSEHGYQPYEICWFKRRPLDGAIGLADIAFAKNDGFLRADNSWGRNPD